MISTLLREFTNALGPLAILPSQKNELKQATAKSIYKILTDIYFHQRILEIEVEKDDEDKSELTSNNWSKYISKIQEFDSKFSSFYLETLMDDI